MPWKHSLDEGSENRRSGRLNLSFLVNYSFAKPFGFPRFARKRFRRSQGQKAGVSKHFLRGDLLAIEASDTRDKVSSYILPLVSNCLPIFVKSQYPLLLQSYSTLSAIPFFIVCQELFQTNISEGVLEQACNHIEGASSYISPYFGTLYKMHYMAY